MGYCCSNGRIGHFYHRISRKITHRDWGAWNLKPKYCYFRSGQVIKIDGEIMKFDYAFLVFAGGRDSRSESLLWLFFLVALLWIFWPGVIVFLLECWGISIYPRFAARWYKQFTRS